MNEPHRWRHGRPVRIATRGSELALWQARWTSGRLREVGAEAELVIVETQGDRDHAPFRDLAGQGFFTKAVQDAVLDGRADLAVHSHKDLPSAPSPGLEIAAVSERADPRDVLLARRDALDPARDPEREPLPLRQGARVGTSAARRRAQLLHARPDLEIAELRGNVPTRVGKLRNGDYDAIVLAAAGLERLELDLADLHVRPLEASEMVPAPAQGVLALEIRRGDDELASLLTDLHDIRAYRAVAAERGLMAMLQGGCQLALGAHGAWEAGAVRLRAWYGGRAAEVEHPSSEGAAMLAFEALGRPSPANGPGSGSESGSEAATGTGGERP